MGLIAPLISLPVRPLCDEDKDHAAQAPGRAPPAGCQAKRCQPRSRRPSPASAAVAAAALKACRCEWWRRSFTCTTGTGEWPRGLPPPDRLSQQTAARSRTALGSRVTPGSFQDGTQETEVRAFAEYFEYAASAQSAGFFPLFLHFGAKYTCRVTSCHHTTTIAPAILIQWPLLNAHIC